MKLSPVNILRQEIWSGEISVKMNVGDLEIIFLFVTWAVVASSGYQVQSALLGDHYNLDH